jgi:hypothetical protein
LQDSGAVPEPEVVGQNRFRSSRPGSLAAQFHKLCANPTNFGWFRPINCESESRNYARSRSGGRRIPQISALRQRLFRLRSRNSDAWARARRGRFREFRLSLALIERIGNRWFSGIGFAFHERTRAKLADSFVLIERTNFGRRQHCLAGACSLIFLARAVAVRQ